MLRFKEFVEALDLSLAKDMKLSRSWSKSYRDDQLNELFDGKDRITIEDGISLKGEVGPSPEYMKIANALLDIGYETSPEKYYKNMAWRTVDNAVPENKRQYIRIGKLINKYLPDLLRPYKLDTTNKEKESKEGQTYDIILSRHPYDLAGISTGRHWRSCMTIATKKDVKEGSHCIYMDKAVHEKMLAVYLVKSEDKNITDPTSRIVLAPFVGREEGDIAWGVGGVYGTKSSHFKKIVDSWVEDKLNSNLKSETYDLDTTIYDDDYDTGFNSSKKYFWVEDVLKEVPEYDKLNFKSSLESSIDTSVSGQVIFYIPSHIPIHSEGKLKKFINILQSGDHLEGNRASNSLVGTITKIPVPNLEHFEGSLNLKQIKERFKDTLEKRGFFDFDYEETKKKIIDYLKENN